MPVDDNVSPELVARLAESSHYRERRAEIAAWNRSSPVLKRGIALTPVKFGISFTATHYNQAGALGNLYADGTVLLNHGGTEMGQGLYTKVAQVVAHELGVTLDRVRVTAADTSKVPNASATAASSGSDLNGMAAQAAARTIRERLVAFASKHFGAAAADVSISANVVRAGSTSCPSRRSCSLPIAPAFRSPPPVSMRRRRFTTTARRSRVGRSLFRVRRRRFRSRHRHAEAKTASRGRHPPRRGCFPESALDRGQIEGGFLQGMGWLTMEQLVWNDRGELTTHSPSTYKIPACRDWPERFNIEFFGVSNREETIHRSKAVGEPPLMLALSVFHALRNAVASAGDGRASPRLDAPATSEAILMAVTELRRRGNVAAAHPDVEIALK
jgi:xanthine dehydrogenase large subunit